MHLEQPQSIMCRIRQLLVGINKELALTSSRVETTDLGENLGGFMNTYGRLP